MVGHHTVLIVTSSMRFLGLGWIVKQLVNSLNASMLCVSDAATNEWLGTKFSSNSNWIGLFRSSDPVTDCKWVTGCSSTYTHCGAPVIRLNQVIYTYLRSYIFFITYHHYITD